jgi:methionyl-tRNA formyltransferase
MVSAPLRIIYFGTPEFAIPSLRQLIASRHHVVSVVSQPDRPRGRGHHLAPTPTKALAQEHGIPVLQPEKVRDEAFLESIRALRPDLGVVAAYGRLLPESLLQVPRLGMINVHASLLPRWRGAAPVHRAVITGDTETGVTIMRVVNALDAGPMFASVRRPIGPEETSPEVERALAELGAALLVDVIDRMADGRATEMPQDERRVTLAPKITRDEGLLDWNLPAVRIHNLVRGLQPWPLVSSRISGGRTLLHRTAVLEERTTASAGTVVRAEGDRLDVATGGGGVLRLVAVQPEGRRVMSAREFLAGHRIAPGLTLDS